MSTRSYIAMKTGENTYRAVYCHYDGYLEYNGRMLLEHYNTQERVEKLLNLGCISSLKEKLEPEAGSHHCFDTPDEGVTVFYGRDRGEKGQEAFTCTEKQLKDPHSWINFIYVCSTRASANSATTEYPPCRGSADLWFSPFFMRATVKHAAKITRKKPRFYPEKLKWQ